MTIYHQQLLYLSDSVGNPTELINGARTAFNLESAAMCGTGQFSNVLSDAGCEALLHEPVCVTNMLTENQSTVGTDTTGLAAETNCSIARTTVQAFEGGSSLQLTSLAAGLMSARTTTGTSGAPVIPGANYTITCRFRAATVGRTCRARIYFYDATGTYQSDTVVGSVTDVTTGWREHSYSVVAPSTAHYACISPEVVGTAAAGEIHYVDALGIILTATSAVSEWGVGGGGDTGALTWQPLALGTASNPWDNGTTHAAEALGFYIEQWTGLDGAHHVRSVVGVGADRGGARFGPQSHNERVMKLNVLLLGSSPQGLDYLFRWLEAQLLGCCNPCGTASIYTRDFCPSELTHLTDAELEAGWTRMDRTVLIDGPTWESEPARNAGCYIRRVSFTLAAGDPCMYGASRREVEATSLISGATLSAASGEAACNTFLGTTRRVTATLEVPDYGSVAPRITIRSNFETDSSGQPKSLPDLRIMGIATVAGSCDPCRLPRVGELILSGFRAAGMEIVVDMAARTIRYRNLAAGVDWEDGSRYLGRNVRSKRRWWAFSNCASGCVIVEPVYAGLLNTFAGTADPVASWDVTIESVSRWSCC